MRLASLTYPAAGLRIAGGVAASAVSLTRGDSTPATRASAGPKSPGLNTTFAAGRRVVPAGESTELRIPVANPLAVAARFEAPNCGCSCRSSSHSKPTLGPGESGELVIVAKPQGAPMTKFRCSWADDAGRAWSAACEVELLPPALFPEPRVQRLDLGPAQKFRVEMPFKQYATTAAGLAAVPAFVCHDPRVKVVSQAESVDPDERGVACRTVTLTVEVDPGPDAGHQSATLSAGTVSGATIEWRTRALVESTPANCVFVAADFNPGPAKRRFLLRGVGGPVRATAAKPEGFAPGAVRASVSGNVVAVEMDRPKTTVNGRVVVTTGVAGQPEISIPLSAFAD